MEGDHTGKCLVAIGGNIEPGDLIVSAGVSFLRDGQAVRLWDPAQ